MNVNSSPYYSEYLKASPNKNRADSKNEPEGDSADNSTKVKKDRDSEPPSYPPNAASPKGDGRYESFLPIFPSAAMVGGSSSYNNQQLDILRLNFGNDLEGWKEAGRKGSLLQFMGFMGGGTGAGVASGGRFSMPLEPEFDIRKKIDNSVDYFA